MALLVIVLQPLKADGTSYGPTVDISTFTTMGDCLAAGGSWSNWIPAGTTATTTLATIMTFNLNTQAVDAAPYECTACHTTPGVVPQAGALCSSCHQPPAPPTAAFFYACDASVSGQVNLNAAPSTCSTGSTCTYAWTGGSVTPASGTLVAATGPADVALTVTAAGGPSAGFTGTVTNSLPACVINAAPECGTPTITLSPTSRLVSFTAADGDAEGAATTVVNWGDTHTSTGVSGVGTSFSNTYAYDGSYMVRRTVQDAAGVMVQCDPFTVTIANGISAPKKKVTVNVSPVGATTNYTTVKVLMNGSIKSQGGTGTSGTWTSAAQPGVNGYRVSVYKYGKTYSCTGAGVGAYDAVTKTWALDLSADVTMTCTLP